MKWHRTDEAVPGDGPHLITGWEYGKENTKRYYAIASFFGGSWFEDGDGDEMYPPTHFASLEAPDNE